MANRTVKDAKSVRGTNPQYIIEKIIRFRIYDAKYWKEECFALSAELLVDKAIDLKFIGGVFGANIQPTPFLCLLLKMLQIQPEKDIVIEFIRQEDFKYLRALCAFYMRLVGTSLDCYKYLEPLYNDHRKLRIQTRKGTFKDIYMYAFINELLHKKRFCDIFLPRIQKRAILEANNDLEPRISALEDDLDEPESDDEDKENMTTTHEKSRAKSSSEASRKESSSQSRRCHSPSLHRHHSRHEERERERADRDSNRRHHRSRSRGKYHSKREIERRHRSRSPRRKRDDDRKSNYHRKH